MLPDVAPHSEAAQRLASAVQLKLTALLGDAYSDNSLAEYIVMMVAHKTQQAQMTENLVGRGGRLLAVPPSRLCAAQPHPRLLSARRWSS